ncbi:hypothetical protein THIOKS12240002 [Thiocapsa sp. KS1]|nr:hypothetical protein THIOKS12240002 [Thiocapsa sp. KS1]
MIARTASPRLSEKRLLFWLGNLIPVMRS